MYEGRGYYRPQAGLHHVHARRGRLLRGLPARDRAGDPHVRAVKGMRSARHSSWYEGRNLDDGIGGRGRAGMAGQRGGGGTKNAGCLQRCEGTAQGADGGRGPGALGAVFAGQEVSQVYFEVRSIKFLTADVAFVDARASQFGSTILKRSMPAYFVLRKTGGEWRIAVMRLSRQRAIL